jgi:hypothetical protein
MADTTTKTTGPGTGRRKWTAAQRKAASLRMKRFHATRHHAGRMTAKRLIKPLGGDEFMRGYRAGLEWAVSPVGKHFAAELVHLLKRAEKGTK